MGGVGLAVPANALQPEQILRLLLLDPGQSERWKQDEESFSKGFNRGLTMPGPQPRSEREVSHQNCSGDERELDRASYGASPALLGERRRCPSHTSARASERAGRRSELAPFRSPSASSRLFSFSFASFGFGKCAVLACRALGDMR